MNPHPYAEIFPRLQGSDLRELADDIKANGLRDAIWTYQGMILDGRNRYEACMLAGVKAELRAFTGTDKDALQLVVSANLHRRQLTVEQKALAAAKAATLSRGFQQKSSENQPHDNASPEALQAREAPPMDQSHAAEKFGVSRSSVQRARKVIEQGSKSLQKAVQDGEVPLARAAAVVGLPKSEQLEAAQSPPSGEGAEPEDGEAERIEALQREYLASVEKVMTADDKLAAANAELKRQAGEIATLKSSRDHWQNKCAALQARVNKLQAKVDRMEKSKG